MHRQIHVCPEVRDSSVRRSDNVELLLDFKIFQSLVIVALMQRSQVYAPNVFPARSAFGDNCTLCASGRSMCQKEYSASDGNPECFSCVRGTAPG